MTEEEKELEIKRLEINISVDELVLTIANLQKENAKLKSQIEKMKCCGNCTYVLGTKSSCGTCRKRNYVNWELAE